VLEYALFVTEELNGPFVTQRAANISIKIDTTKEFATDEQPDYNDLEKTEVGTPSATTCLCNP
jgi:hypothetical protein